MFEVNQNFKHRHFLYNRFGIFHLQDARLTIGTILLETFVTEYPMLQFKSVAVPNGASILLHFKPKN